MRYNIDMKRNRVTKCCETCGNAFEIKASQAARTRTCSWECRSVAMSRDRQKPIEERYNMPIRDLLIEMYVTQRKGIKQIAREFEMSDNTLWHWFDALNIPRRNGSEAVANQWENNEERRAATGELFGKLSRERAATQPNIATRADVRAKISQAKQGDGNAMWKGGRSTPHPFICEMCGSEFEARPTDEQRFCSQRCFRRFTGETGFERAVRIALTELSIDFVQEYPVSRYFIDFYLPQYDVALECDGDYWHGTQEQQESDARKDALLLQRGLQVIRLKEGDFHRKRPETEIKQALTVILLQ